MRGEDAKTEGSFSSGVESERCSCRKRLASCGGPSEVGGGKVEWDVGLDSERAGMIGLLCRWLRVPTPASAGVVQRAIEIGGIDICGAAGGLSA